MLKATLAALALLACASAPAFADTVDCTVAANKDSEECKPKKDLSGFGLGTAVNYTFSDEIDTAFLDTNGIIRTNEKTRGDVSFILESHFLTKTDSYLPPWLRWADLGGKLFKNECAGAENTYNDDAEIDCGSGPFLAVKTGGSTELIESVGVGYMWGFRHKAQSSLGGVTQWNFGLGISIDPHVKRLAGGMRQGQPLPAGETEIRYEDDIVFGAMMLFSIGIG